MKRNLSTDEKNLNSSESETEILSKSNSILLSLNEQIKKKFKMNDDDSKSKEILPLCPFIEFNGQIEYYSTSDDIIKACEKLLNWLETIKDNDDIKIIPIAFDMEWPVNFKRGAGSGKTAVIQLCANESICYVFSIGELNNLPIQLIDLLLYPKVLLHGVNIKQDFRKLGKDFPNNIKSNLLIDKCIDLSKMYNDIQNTKGRWSLEKLVNEICRLRIDKSKEIRMSEWDCIPLDEIQLKYAAIDVYIGQVIYRKLQEIQLKKEEEKLKLNAMKNLEENNLKDNNEIDAQEIVK